MKIKKHHLLIALLYLTFSTLFSQDFTLQKLWETPDVLTTSESVCYYPDDHSLFISCINGNPVEKDGNGFIAKISITGEIITLNWINGLNAPKGMGLHNNFLYVTDIDEVVMIDISASKIIKKTHVDDAKFLNDIAIDNDGNVYISDMATNKIHILKNDKVETWLENSEIVGPNGLLISGKDLVVGTKKGIFHVRLSDKKFWHMVKNTGGIDGIKMIDEQHYIISDWSGKVQLVNMEREPIELLNTTDEGINAADFEYIKNKHWVIIPTFSDNRVVAYELR
ncbi:MAG: hypothetical protein R2750_12375 [Bacteroidales bacterium]